MKVYLDSVNKIQRQFLEHEEITIKRKRTLCDSLVKTCISSDFASTIFPSEYHNGTKIQRMSEQNLIEAQLTTTWMHRITFKLK